MPRPTGSKNNKVGKTFFFNLNDQASQVACHQVSIHHSPAGHWYVLHYLNGEKQGNVERQTYQQAVKASGMDHEDFDLLFERTVYSRFKVDLIKRNEERNKGKL